MTKIRIAALIDDPANIEIGPRRALDAICADARFALSAIIEPPTRAASGASVFRAAMAIDAALFARPRSCDAPAFEAQRVALNIYSVDAIIADDAIFDVIIDLSTAGAPAVLASRAAFGVWRLTSYEFFAGFFETRSPVADIALYRVCGEPASARRIASATYTVKFSAARNAAFLREKSVQLLIRELKRLAIDGAPADDGSFEPAPARRPHLGDLAAYGVHLVRNLSARVLEQAAIRARFRPGMFLLRHGNGGPLDFDPADGTDIGPAGNNYWADPFLFEHDDAQYVFFEDYPYAEGRGHIGVGKFTEDGFTLIGPAIITDYHLSFPFIFRHEGAIYMIPETTQTRRLEIWRCVDFPCRWERCAAALEGVVAADSALFHRNGEWWLFTNVTNDSYGDHCTELHLYRASDPALRELEPHPLNPVVIDARSARGGGRIFSENGALYRVSQDNAFSTYGYGVNVMEITRLDMEGYDERLARRIAPDFEDGLIGCHHADFSDGRYIIDVRRAYGGRAGAPVARR